MNSRNKKFNDGVRKQLLSKSDFLRSMNCSDLKCPICDAHLTIGEFLGNVDLICLNTCHLNENSQKLYQDIVNEVVKKVG